MEELQKWYSDFMSRIVGKIRGGQELSQTEISAVLTEISNERLAEFRDYVERRFNSLGAKIDKLREELLANDERVKRELIDYVDKTRKDLMEHVNKVREDLLANDEKIKKDLIEYVNKTRNDLIEYVDKTRKDLIDYVDKTKRDILDYVNKVREELLANDERIAKELGSRIDKLENRVSNLETRVSNLEVRVERLEKGLEATRNDLGILAEDLYLDRLLDYLERAGEKVVDVTYGYETPLGEVDAVIETEKAVYVVEVKLKAETKDVDDILDKSKAVSRDFPGRNIVPVLTGGKIGKVVRGYAKGVSVKVFKGRALA